MENIKAERRKLMESQLQNPIIDNKPIQFSANSIEEISEGDIVIDEEYIEPTIHPLIALQNETNLFKDLQDRSFDQQEKPEPIIQQKTDVPEFDPKYGPLYRMSAYQRKKMYQKWFQQAISNVDEQISNNLVSPKTRDRLIREETSRLQENYLETH